MVKDAMESVYRLFLTRALFLLINNGSKTCM